MGVTLNSGGKPRPEGRSASPRILSRVPALSICERIGIRRQSPVMRVKVHAAGYCSFEHIGDDGFMDLPEGATLNDVFAKLGIPRIIRRLPFAAVNYVQARPGTELADGDVVSLIGAVSGG